MNFVDLTKIIVQRLWGVEAVCLVFSFLETVEKQCKYSRTCG